MNILILGKNDSSQKGIIENLKLLGHIPTRAHHRNEIPDGGYDFCIDTFSRDTVHLRMGLAHIKGIVPHYILISSHQVYPDLPKNIPWNPDDIDLLDDTGFADLSEMVKISRAVERELFLSAPSDFSWTILRPSIIENPSIPDRGLTPWFVERIIDGSPLILPDFEEPIFRHISVFDLTNAIITIACHPDRFSHKIIHVADQGIFTFTSYAQLIMKALKLDVPIHRIPISYWEEADLEFPMGKHLHSSFIDDSRLLRESGWEPSDESEWIVNYARKIAAKPSSPSPTRDRELKLINHIKNADPGLDVQSNWCLAGDSGCPNSLREATETESNNTSYFPLKTLAFSMGIAAEQFLLGHSPKKTTLIMSHNALLSPVDSQSPRLSNRYYLAVPHRPCGIISCELCKDEFSGISGIDENGFARTYNWLPVEHLIPVPRDLGTASLLADPLSCLISIFLDILSDNKGPVWIYGQQVEAVLAHLIIKESSGAPPVHISRSPADPVTVFHEIQFISLHTAINQVNNRTIEAPSLAVNASGSRDGDNLLSMSLTDGGVLLSPFVNNSVEGKILHANLPIVSPSPNWLKKAVERLDSWKSCYDLATLLQPVDQDNFHEIFLPEPFRLAYISIS